MGSVWCWSDRLEARLVKVLAIAMFVLAASLPSQGVNAQAALGANYNESLTQINECELDRVNADWVRGFFDSTS